jgi:hypothetical protein
MSELKTTDDFALHVDSWYKNQLNVINHFLDVPEGVRMEVDGVENILSGDSLVVRIIPALLAGVVMSRIITRLPGLDISCPETDSLS